ncbi:hypothetical protein AB9N09_002336 [Vibrio cholerae]
MITISQADFQSLFDLIFVAFIFALVLYDIFKYLLAMIIEFLVAFIEYFVERPRLDSPFYRADPFKAYIDMRNKLKLLSSDTVKFSISGRRFYYLKINNYHKLICNLRYCASIERKLCTGGDFSLYYYRVRESCLETVRIAIARDRSQHLRSGATQ